MTKVNHITVYCHLYMYDFDQKLGFEFKKKTISIKCWDRVSKMSIGNWVRSKKKKKFLTADWLWVPVDGCHASIEFKNSILVYKFRYPITITHKKHCNQSEFLYQKLTLEMVIFCFCLFPGYQSWMCYSCRCLKHGKYNR